MSEEKKKKEDSLKKIADIYYQELKAEIKKEIDEPEYLAQAEFPNCSTRAAAITAKAKARCDKILSLMIINHREGKHGESYREERKGLESKMPKEDIELAARGFWRS